MSAAPLRVLPTPEGIGEQIAPKILEDIARARNSGACYLLGCPTGRTPRPIYAAIARRLAHTRQDLSHLVLVMMDEYLAPSARGFKYAASTNRWSCHDFARREIADQWNSVLPAEFRLRDDSVWFPDPNQPETYDIEIRRAGGIDLFLLASGASDGHVAFNPPGSARNSTTRIIELSDETRRDNLKTFPSFGKLSKVPTHGISVGIDTIASARRKVMVVWGEGKRLTLKRIIAASRYESDWPATVVHEGVGGEILADNAASA